MKINSINPNYKYNNSFSKNSSNNANNQSFKGGGENPVVNGLSKFYTKVADTKVFQTGLKNFSKSNNSFTQILVMESCFLSGFYMLNTLKNKKIKKEQKPQMIINDALTLGVSTAGACLAEDKIGNLVTKGAEKYFGKHADFYKKLGKQASETSKNELLNKVSEVAASTTDKLSSGLDDVSELIGTQLKGAVGKADKLKTFQITPDKLKSIQDSVKETITNNIGNSEKAKESVKGIIDDVYNNSAARAEADKVLPGFNKLKVLVIFGLIYRYLGPVVITPIANKLSSTFFRPKENKEKAEGTKN